MSATAITASVGILFAGIGAAGLRRALLLLLFMLPFLPAYIAIPFGGDGAGISAARLATAVLVMYLFASLMTDRERWKPVLGRLAKERMLLVLFGILFLGKLLSTFMVRGVDLVLVYWFDEVFLALLMVLVSARVFLRSDSIRSLLQVFTFSAVVLLLLIALEVSSGKPLLSGVIEVQVLTAGQDVLAGRERLGLYRAQALFENSLLLAEYLLFLFLVFLLLPGAVHARWRLAYLVLSLTVLGFVYFAGARFPLVWIAVLSAFLLAYKLMLAAPARYRKLWLYAIYAVTGLVFVLVVRSMSEFERAVDMLSFFHGDDPSARASLISRAQQWTMIPAEVFSNYAMGFLGEGYRSNLLERLDVKLDNYFFRLLIEGGLVSLVAYCLIIGWGISRALRIYQQHARGVLLGLDLKRLGLFLLLFFTSFFIAKLFLSLGGNNYLLYLFIGLVIALEIRLSTHAHPARP